MSQKAKIRVNVSVDKELLLKAKSKLNLFGGKLSTLFNIYLREFTSSINDKLKDKDKEFEEKIKELESRIICLECGKNDSNIRRH